MCAKNVWIEKLPSQLRIAKERGCGGIAPWIYEGARTGNAEIDILFGHIGGLTNRFQYFARILRDATGIYIGRVLKITGKVSAQFIRSPER